MQFDRYGSNAAGRPIVDSPDANESTEENYAYPAGWRMRIVKGAPFALLVIIFGPMFVKIIHDAFKLARYVPVQPQWVVDLEKHVWVVIGGLWLGYPIAMTVLAMALRWLHARSDAHRAVCGIGLWLAMSLAAVVTMCIHDELQMPRD
jgi:hypothetical protein